MNRDKNDIDLIDKYLREELSGNTLQDFEHRLATDMEFAQQVDWHKRLVSGIKKQSQRELKSYLQSLEGRESTTDEKKTVPLNYWKFAIAASVILLMIAAFWVYLFRPAPQDLFAQYYQPYPNVETTVERNEQDTDAYTQAFQWYEDGQYDKAATAFEHLLSSDNQTEAVYFYAGLTALERNLPKAALTHFENIITNPENKYYQQALWYAALAAIKQKDINRAKAYLQTLSDKGGFYENKAEQLLAEF